VIAGSDSSTILSKEDFREGTDYYARLRVSDGYNWSSWSVLPFKTNNRPPAPVPVFPVNNRILDWGLWPNFAVRNTTDPDGDSIEYKFELYTDLKMKQSVAAGTGKKLFNMHIWEVPVKLKENQKYWWRVCANDVEDGNWCPLQEFAISFQDDPILPFDLTYPPDSAILKDSTILFKWQMTEDPDPDDSITFSLYLSRTNDFTESLEFNKLNSNGLEMPFEIDRKVTYYWKVKAIRDEYHSRWNNNRTKPYYIFKRE